MSEVAIRIDGLAQFTRDLRKIDSNLPKAMRIALNKGAQLVVDEAKPRVPSRTGRAAASLRAQSTRTAVRVTAGGRRAPYYPWLDWGGRVGRLKRTRRAFIQEGRYIYPAYYAVRDSGKVQRVLERALLDVVRQAGVVVD